MTDLALGALTTEDVAALLGCSVDTVRRMRRKGQGPRYVVLTGGSVRYFKDSVDEWIAAGGNATKKEANDA
jgi:excisionase family DNA binding protein